MGGPGGKTVGTIRGSIGQGMLEARGDLQEVKLYTSNEAEFADVIAGRLDVVMEDGLKIGQFLKKNPDVALELATGYAPPADEYGYARYGIRKDDVDLNLAVSRALGEIRADGTLSTIVKEYGFTDRNLWFFPSSKPRAYRWESAASGRIFPPTRWENRIDDIHQT